MADDQSNGILTTVYVVKFLEKPSHEHLRPKRPVPMAIELPVEAAQEVAEYIQKRIAAGDTGAIRIHLLVDLAHV